MKINITTGTQDTLNKHMVHRNNDQLNIVLFTGLQRVNLLSLVWEHWPDTREFITQTVKLWSTWIRL